jgi:hypothetical protein
MANYLFFFKYLFCWNGKSWYVRFGHLKFPAEDEHAKSIGADVDSISGDKSTSSFVGTSISSAAVGLLQALLHHDQRHRLGVSSSSSGSSDSGSGSFDGGGGFKQLRGHPFFTNSDEVSSGQWGDGWVHLAQGR